MAPLRSALVLVSLLAGCPREVEVPPSGDAAPESAEPAELSEDDRAAIERLLDDQRSAWNRGDLDGFLAAYEPSDRLLFTSGAKIRRGFTETRDKYRERYGSASETMGQLAFELLDVRGLGADAAIVLGRYRLTATPEASEGVFTIVLERQAGTWRIVHDHTSAAREPPPAEAPVEAPTEAITEP
ncbi:YybH family protein [Nannocystaceae bacterium ST9]